MSPTPKTLLSLPEEARSKLEALCAATKFDMSRIVSLLVTETNEGEIKQAASKAIFELGEPLQQWQCDTCGRLIKKPRHGTVTFRLVPEAGPMDRYVDFRIVHNGNVNDGVCQGDARLDTC